MRMFKQKDKPASEDTRGDFETAAAQVSATAPMPEVGDLPPEVQTDQGRLTIRADWATYVSHACFFPASKLLHPAYALTEEEAQALSPKMQSFLQEVADKYAPEWMGYLTNKYPALFDIFMVIAALHFQKMKLVKQIRLAEAQERARLAAEQKKEDARTIDMAPVPPSVHVGTLPATPAG